MDDPLVTRAERAIAWVIQIETTMPPQDAFRPKAIQLSMHQKRLMATLEAYKELGAMLEQETHATMRSAAYWDPRVQTEIQGK